MRGIHRLLQTGLYCLYHMTNVGTYSLFEVALALREILARPEVEIAPVSSAHFPMPAPRARSEAVDNLKLRLLEYHWMRPWREALDEYLTSELRPVLVAGREG